LEVIVLTGDGSLLMNLGALVSVVSSGATNLSVVLLDNGVYEVTGGQATPAQGTPLDYAQLARAIGFASTCRVDDLGELRTRIDTALAGPGPRFLWLCVGAAEAADLQTPPTPLPDQLRRLQPKLPKLQR
jgi:phosphonopyruvate decarboxylase